MNKILLLASLFLTSLNLVGSYQIGQLNTVAHGGTGFGDGSPAQGYANESGFIVYGSTIQADGKIIGVGQINGIDYAIVFRLNSDGSADESFNGLGNRILFFGSNASGKDAAMLSNNNIAVVGYVNNQYFMTQVNSDGSDTPVSIANNVTAGSSDVAYQVLVDQSDTIYVVGTSAQTEVGTSIFIAKYNSDGVLQTSYNSGAVTSGSGSALTQAGIALFSLTGFDLSASGAYLDHNGNILVAGSYGSADGIVCRFTANGLLDTTFGSNGYVVTSDIILSDVALQSVANDYHVVTCGTSVTDGIVIDLFDADATNSPVSFTSVCGGSSASCKNLTIQENDQIVISGTVVESATNNFLIARLVSSAQEFDITFGTQGYTVDISGSQAASLSVQTDSSFIVTGNNDAGGVVANYLGGNIVQTAGILDTNYNQEGTVPGFLDLTNELPTNLASPSAAKSIVYMSDGSYFVLSDNGYQAYDQNATDSYVIKFNADNSQNINFGTHGVLTISGMKQANGILLDQQNNLIIVGMSDYPSGFIMCCSPVDGWEFWSIVTNDFYYNYTVVQQMNGRIIVAGATDAGPALQAFNPLTGGRDITFGTQGVYTVFSEYEFAFHACALDNQDNIYCMADLNNIASTFKISQSGQLVWTSQTGVSSANNIFEQIAIDQNNHVIVASITSDFGSLIFDSYDSGTGVSILENPLMLNLYSLGCYRPQCHGFVIDTTTPAGNIVICGGDYESGSISNTGFVARILSDLSGFDTTFNSSGDLPGVQTVQAGSPTGIAWNNLVIAQDGTITACGYETFSSMNKAYLMRLYGNDGIGQYAPMLLPAGIPGTIDAGFGAQGYLRLSSISGPASSQIPQVVVPLNNGYQYVAFDQGALIQLNNNSQLSSFGMSGYGNNAPDGVASMIIDGTGHPLLVGTNGNNEGWIVRYTNNLTGVYDSDFNGGAPIYFGNYSRAIQVLEQTSSRIIVSGENSSGYGTLWALTSSGILDTTFNSNHTPGSYSIDPSHIIQAVIADEYDRLVFANYKGDSIYVRRLTQSGQLDTSFGVNGIVADAITGADQAVQVCLAFDNHGNIVLAAHTQNGIVVVAYDQNGLLVENALTLSQLTDPTLTGLLATSDGKILLSGNQTDSAMWIARVQDNGSGSYILDTTFARDDIVPGILQFSFVASDESYPRYCNSIAMYPTGEISIIGYETIGQNFTFMTRVYDNAYNATQEPSCQLSRLTGTNDITFGCNGDRGILFNATENQSSYSQQAQACALQDDQNLIIAINYQETQESVPAIVMNKFDVDGLIDTSFNDQAAYPYANGSALVLDNFDAQYVQDMITFTTSQGVTKALLSGYINNTTLNMSNSLLLQYILDESAPNLDTSFGGFNDDPAGVSIGNLPSQSFSLARQSMGRIILGGAFPNSNQPNSGIFQAYTSDGLLDQSFGLSGYYVQPGFGIYTSAIDSQDRIVCAYINAQNQLCISRILADGSGPDLSFADSGTQAISFNNYTIASNNNIQMALDIAGNIFCSTVLDQDGAQSIVMIMLNDQGAIEHNRIFESRFFGGLSYFTITKMLITAESNTRLKRIILVGYDQADQNNEIMIASFNEYAGELILTWYFNPENTPGYIKYMIENSSDQITGRGLIHPDGRIILTGCALPVPLG